MDTPGLLAHEYDSEPWRKLTAWLEGRLAAERATNDSLTLDPIATARIRGRIGLLKELLALPTQDVRAVPEADDSRPSVRAPDPLDFD